MKEKTFDEIIKETPLHDLMSIPEMDLVKELMRQVREATWEEFRQALLGVTLPAENLRKIGRIVAATNRITITDND